MLTGDHVMMQHVDTSLRTSLIPTDTTPATTLLAHALTKTSRQMATVPIAGAAVYILVLPHAVSPPQLKIGSQAEIEPLLALLVKSLRSIHPTLTHPPYNMLHPHPDHRSRRHAGKCTFSTPGRPSSNSSRISGC